MSSELGGARFVATLESVSADHRRLIDANLGLVHRTVDRVAGWIRETNDVEDLVQDGFVGLLQAVRRFDPTRGVSFSDYADSRVRGAILDGLRSRRLGRWSPHRDRREASFVSLESAARRIRGTLADDRPTPDRVLENRERSDLLALGLSELPPRERLVLSLHYAEKVNLKQIGARLGVTESRISQLCSQAARRLRRAVESRLHPSATREAGSDELDDRVR